MALKWRKQMSVGNTLIDDEHRYLFCLINTIELATRTDDAHDILATTLDQLVEYTKTHFDIEEQIQLKIKYPGLEQHKKEHKKIMTDLHEVKKKLDSILSTKKSTNSTAAVPQKDISDSEIEQLLEDNPDAQFDESDLTPLVKLMRRWIIEHVLVSDMKMKPYLAKHHSLFS